LIQNYYQKMSKFLSVRTAKAVFIFLSALALMAYIQFNPANPYFSGYDDYYHAEMAEIIKEKGIIHQFPWMQYTILKDKFVDHHFLFHVLLIPFVSFMGIVNGAKIFIVIVVALTFSMFYLLLAQNRLIGAFWLTLFAIFTMPLDFYFRMNFVRAMGLSLLFMCLGLYFIFKKRPTIVFLLSFFYVWAYDTFMILPFIALAYAIVQFLKGEKPSWKTALASFGGMIAGLIINPYFPDNISFIATHLFATGFGAKEYTGGEWRPYNTWFWLTTNCIPLTIFAAGILIALIHNYKQSSKAIIFLLITILFLVLQWKSKRFVEYTPFFITLAGVIMLKGFISERIEEWQKEIFFKRRENFIYGAAIILFLLASFFYSRQQIEGAKLDTRNDFSMSALEKVQDYLKNNSQEGDIIFTDDWDVFPKYFFTNHKNYYLVGLDPEFMNQYSGWPYEGKKGKLYAEWADISSGRDSENLERIKNNYKAKWILVGTDHEDLVNNLEARPDLFKQEMLSQSSRSESDDPSIYNDGYYLFQVL